MAKEPGHSFTFSRTGRSRLSLRHADTPARVKSRKPGRRAPQVRPAFNFGRIALYFITLLTLSALLSLHLLPDKVALHVGDVSDIDVRAQRTTSYVDQLATQQLRDEAAARAEVAYTSVPYAASESDQTIQDIFTHLRRERSAAAPSAPHVAAILRQEVGVMVSTPSLLAPLLQDATAGYHIDQAERVMRSAVHDALENEIRDDHPADLSRAQEEVAEKISASMLPRSYLPAVTRLANSAVHPNRARDDRRTEAARDAERRLVAPQINRIFTGDLVVRRGETVTTATVDKLRALGLQNPRLDPMMIACVSLLVTMLLSLVCLYLSRYYPRVYVSTKTLVLLSVLVVLCILGLKLGDTILGVRLSGSQYGYVGMLCVASTGMLISALVNPRLALLITALLAAQSGFILGDDLRFCIMTLLSTLVGIYAVSDIRSRSDVVRAAAALSLVNVALSLVVGKIENDAWADMQRAAFWAIGSGVMSVALFSLGAALFERLFGITTHLGLLELSDPNRPLLQKFCQLAPGTYTHSVMVGNLAVTACEAIGADALLCRVGAYYHDLGKMRRPEFFIENQLGGSNIHNKLNPSLSALVLTAHVKEGLEIAEEENLPPVIKDFISQHHGTSLIRYFYHQQTLFDGGDAAPGLEQQFRYGGPKPQSRETAILMLADSVEAASRTLDKPTVGRIEDLVDQIISTHLGDGQLDECDLTLRDLRGIRDAFVHLLGGMLHNRIEYPDALKQASGKTDKTDKNGITDKPADERVLIAEVQEEPEVGDKSSVAA
ncbi:HD family phosphohydrolase [Capsulimonas corticalis]|uniref:HD family phosphohydrolase n=1 Tax=Capsulimonas corticalis TaxID=2219043 RepID=A0A402CXR6_9BACT|nr:HDIG domain-containing metalloprotein [Capsulimonas corticalis]BDI32171.1 HD family phosphohydrolase [Capsulimonas corticalis]